MMLDRLEGFALRYNPPTTQPSTGLAHAPKYTPPTLRPKPPKTNPPKVPVNFSAGRGGPYLAALLSSTG